MARSLLHFLIIPVIIQAVRSQSATSSSFTIHDPDNPTHCQLLHLSWTGGVGPYLLSVIDASGSNVVPVTDNGREQSTGLTWLVDLPAGTIASLSIRDSTGRATRSNQFTVSRGADTSCLRLSGDKPKLSDTRNDTGSTPSLVLQRRTVSRASATAAIIHAAAVKRSHPGAIIAAVIIGVTVLLVGVVIFWCFCRPKKRYNNITTKANANTESYPMSTSSSPMVGASQGTEHLHPPITPGWSGRQDQPPVPVPVNRAHMGPYGMYPTSPSINGQSREGGYDQTPNPYDWSGHAPTPSTIDPRFPTSSVPLPAPPNLVPFSSQVPNGAGADPHIDADGWQIYHRMPEPTVPQHDAYGALALSRNPSTAYGGIMEEEERHGDGTSPPQSHPPHRESGPSRDASPEIPRSVTHSSPHSEDGVAQVQISNLQSQLEEMRNEIGRLNRRQEELMDVPPPSYDEGLT
ncbi:hypothetical protein JAAARDRAFT_69200 [Jaapia argillacea MUCL 33604]|uniref:Dystroglycan-type cadherin-like domain-containing protein n=1 Tax=Jaapia argillacea MUCL 33604 TaxID=933084 RepID=A0A067PVL7_9AGAM|nr:hypothetical protein JAAARDRAFT_69200 [Jaapia argillacea MUCL 33604]